MPCEHVLERKEAWNWPGVYVTCAICKTVAHAPGIYQCRRCSIFVCTACSVAIEIISYINEEDDTIDLDEFDIEEQAPDDDWSPDDEWAPDGEN